MIATGAGLFTVACLLVVVAGSVGRSAYAYLIAGTVLVGVGECFHTSVLSPLAADLAPAAVRGRYMAALGLSWWVGLATAPILGPSLLTVAPAAAFLVSGAVAASAGVAAFALERRLPQAALRTPIPLKVRNG
jgi:hypothetical protein